MTTRNPFDIAFGYATGFKQTQVAGFNRSLSDAAWYVLGPSLQQAKTAGFGANDIALSDTPGTLSIVAANPADDGLVAVSYLDANYYERIARYDLAVSNTIDQFTGAPVTALRCNHARYIGSGNIGDIDVLVGAGLVSRIEAGDGWSRVCLFTVPWGQPSVLTGWIIAAQATKPVEMRLRARQPNREPITVITLPARETLESSSLQLPIPIEDMDFGATPPAKVRYGLDLWIEAKRPAAGGTGEASGNLQITSQQTVDDLDSPGY